MNSPTPTGRGLRGDLLVVAPDAVEPGYRLAGVRTAVAADGADVIEVVAPELAAARPGVVAIHPELFAQVPPWIRRSWEHRTAPLVVVLPDDRGVAGPAKRHGLRELLAGSIGYEITFSPQGERS